MTWETCVFSFMEHGDFTNTDYSAFLKPVVEALRGMVQAGINGRNDLGSGRRQDIRKRGKNL